MIIITIFYNYTQTYVVFPINRRKAGHPITLSHQYDLVFSPLNFWNTLYSMSMFYLDTSIIHRPLKFVEFFGSLTLCYVFAGTLLSLCGAVIFSRRMFLRDYTIPPWKQRPSTKSLVVT